MANEQSRKKFRVTTSHFSGPESDRINRHYEITADIMDVAEGSSSAMNPILTFEIVEDGETLIVAVFESWDAAWEEGTVTEVQPMAPQIVNALETVPDNFQPRARPTRHDRG